MCVTVKGGEAAILSSYKLLDAQRRGDPSLPELTVDQIPQQLKLPVDKAMTEGPVNDPELAALAITQASGDLIWAISLLTANRAPPPPGEIFCRGVGRAAGKRRGSRVKSVGNGSSSGHSNVSIKFS